MTDGSTPALAALSSPSTWTNGNDLRFSHDLILRRAAPQGFGDRQNSWAWSMLWWRGKLYVGTNRAWHCAERAAFHKNLPLFIKYPSQDTDAECAEDYNGLPLQAEIWRWTPETDHWERVYQSPQDVPIPGQSGKFTARDVGFRHMHVFVEPDGTEALYVSGVSPRFIFRSAAPPRLLRTTDGAHFEAVPHDPGTTLGDIETGSYRTIVTYDNRMFVLTGTIQGDGVILESSNPAGGNDNFRQISPPGMKLFEMIPFNGLLYFGIRDAKNGYAVLRTDATGSAPYEFTPVVTQGGYLPEPSRGVISMHVFKDRLYVGGDRPQTEVIRIYPDDSWDLVMGAPRETPAGWKYPLSGIDAGFNDWLNGHIWRMQAYNDRLYIGTMKMSTHLREFKLGPVLDPNYGFDLYETSDGWNFSPITTQGFGDKFSCGVRSFATSPEGIFIGVANNWYGLDIWQGVPQGAIEGLPEPACRPPDRLEAEQVDGKVVLSWDHPGGAGQFHILRASVSDQRHLAQGNPLLAGALRLMRRFILPLRPDVFLPPMPSKVWIPGAYEEIGTTTDHHYEDATVVPGERYVYYVRAESSAGELTTPSNALAAPLLAPPVTFDLLLGWLDGVLSKAGVDAEAAAPVRQQVMDARAAASEGDLAVANGLLQSLAAQIGNGSSAAVPDLYREDLQILLHKLNRRVSLRQVGIITGNSLVA